MRKKLEGNGMWESSRMMLPEHKDRINRHNKELDIKRMPILDEQKLEIINNTLREAFEGRQEIALTLFHPTQSYTVIGYISKFDVLNQRIWMGQKWINLSEIIDCK
ncbi:YolD-like family protein [Paenibacillus radicis (ex Xue et al. 2023)]|uniref:YolD-like family protein n=1 Tax=Paenibacillus radicis (ex Xue et al. 2023) TaxID=2972489 RepID=A0ABT1YMD4_9BACL|nr:YolD-like family protein [Paenibacillus radicis (ex Xue et al. 2023)]MCR8634321.1 YolD-like family protein [Paenibacillus radicis (ex Xue et al. 2023)]